MKKFTPFFAKINGVFRILRSMHAIHPLCIKRTAFDKKATALDILRPMKMERPMTGPPVVHLCLEKEILSGQVEKFIFKTAREKQAESRCRFTGSFGGHAMGKIKLL